MFNLSFLSSAVVQPSIVIRGGVQLSVYDGFATQRWDVFPGRCSTG